MRGRLSSSVMNLEDNAEVQSSMDTTPPKPAARRPPSRMPLSPTAAVLLAISFGLCGGYLDLVIIVFKKYCWND